MFLPGVSPRLKKVCYPVASPFVSFAIRFPDTDSLTAGWDIVGMVLGKSDFFIYGMLVSARQRIGCREVLKLTFAQRPPALLLDSCCTLSRPFAMLSTRLSFTFTLSWLFSHSLAFGFTWRDLKPRSICLWPSSSGRSRYVEFPSHDAMQIGN